MKSEQLLQVLLGARAALKFANDQSETAAEIKANTVLIDALDEAARIAERENPEPVKILENHDNFYLGKCPTCGRIIKSYTDVKYCSKCGQRIAWGDAPRTHLEGERGAFNT